MSARNDQPANRPGRKADSTLRSNGSTEQLSKRRFGKCLPPDANVPTDRKQSIPHQPRPIARTSKDSTEDAATGKNFRLEDFDILKSLGKGSFGQVKLIRHRKTHMLYALKILQKEMIRGSKHIQHIQNERNILRRLSQDAGAEPRGSKLSRAPAAAFFVGFHESMQDDLNLYLLLEYLPGGELLKQIKQHLSLSMTDSQFYLAEVLTAIH